MAACSSSAPYPSRPEGRWSGAIPGLASRRCGRLMRTLRNMNLLVGSPLWRATKATYATKVRRMNDRALRIASPTVTQANIGLEPEQIQDGALLTAFLVVATGIMADGS